MYYKNELLNTQPVVKILFYENKNCVEKIFILLTETNSVSLYRFLVYIWGKRPLVLTILLTWKGEENNMRIQEYINPYFTHFFHYEVPLKFHWLNMWDFSMSYVGAFQWKLIKFSITLCSQSCHELIMMKEAGNCSLTLFWDQGVLF